METTKEMSLNITKDVKMYETVAFYQPVVGVVFSPEVSVVRMLR